MMIAYLNTMGHTVVQLPVEAFGPQLEKKVWGDWSPATVLAKMDVKKYAVNAARIRKANMSYPIIVTGKQVIVDGYHRVAKALLEGQTHINAYVFGPALMNKFIIDRDLNFVKVHQHMTVADILELWTKRFCTT
jgi:thiamine pyrophosphate-dependent acetolactate synthase large subunit-like protein